MQQDSLTNYVKSFKHFLTEKQYEVSHEAKTIPFSEVENIFKNYLREWFFYLSKKEYLNQLRGKYSEIFSAYEDNKHNISLIILKIKEWVYFIQSDQLINYQEYLSLKNQIDEVDEKEDEDKRKLIDDFIFTEKYESLQSEFDVSYAKI